MSIKEAGFVIFYCEIWLVYQNRRTFAPEKET